MNYYSSFSLLFFLLQLCVSAADCMRLVTEQRYAAVSERSQNGTELIRAACSPTQCPPSLTQPSFLFHCLIKVYVDLG